MGERGKRGTECKNLPTSNKKRLYYGKFSFSYSYLHLRTCCLGIVNAYRGCFLLGSDNSRDKSVSYGSYYQYKNIYCFKESVYGGTSCCFINTMSYDGFSAYRESVDSFVYMFQIVLVLFLTCTNTHPYFTPSRHDFLFCYIIKFLFSDS